MPDCAWCHRPAIKHGRDPQGYQRYRCKPCRRTFTLPKLRRYTRLTNGYSRRLDHLRAMLAIWVAVYNFCVCHGTLKQTPAQAAGLTDHKWTLPELLETAPA